MKRTTSSDNKDLVCNDCLPKEFDPLAYQLYPQFKTISPLQYPKSIMNPDIRRPFVMNHEGRRSTRQILDDNSIVIELNDKSNDN